MGKNNNMKNKLFLLVLVLVTIILVACDAKGDDSQLPNEDKGKEKIDYEYIVDFSYYEEVPNVNHNQYFEPVKVKGIYVSGHTAGSQQSLDNLIQLANETEINSFVIDVKNDDGFVTFKVDVPLVNELNTDRNIIRNINSVMDQLYDNNIFPIARIVVFKDNYLAHNMKDFAIKNPDGSLWYYKNVAWVNPYNRDSWEYIIDICKEAAKVGFKEIQFDYIRFEATSTLLNADLGYDSEEVKRTEVIAEFLDYAREELESYNVIISADVFGIVFHSQRDANTLGQDYIEMSKRLDVISPMVYPSHYGFGGYYGTPRDIHPDWFPYEILYGSMMNSNQVLDTMDEGDPRPIVRPWLQAFTATYLRAPHFRVYRGPELREQIQGVYDAGLEEWLLWNARSNYDAVRDGLLPNGN
ncbi:hypothetical protein EDC18_105150 [Natranaerovirga pectinivora]|uniref:DUF4015 domain-containing protein n=1 Tax=Natranaerovirga pectinivora TaxID=682400 RepID=A0A4R3MLB9_9FIRM|nr:putative glycoside hydrolase [Natranaerovirga pectinivora]TCT14668.1 hypothetical protein EDC18_105150 [Natranaerovirga pectinivora]